ncbi:MAG: hypothetical protein ACJA1L_003308 [Paracoccaceae bacterium]|jgi:hypothetical protein
MMTKDRAETTAVQALGWMAGREDTLEAFLGAAGCAPEDLRARAGDPEFLGFVLDFLLGDEAALMAFCDDCGLPYAAPMQARAALPGGDQWHWT